MELNIHKELADLIAEGRVITMIIPDIGSVNYGRGVGYQVIEHVPPPEIHDISATKIREQMKKDTRCTCAEFLPSPGPEGSTICQECGGSKPEMGGF